MGLNYNGNMEIIDLMYEKCMEKRNKFTLFKFTLFRIFQP